MTAERTYEAPIMDVVRFADTDVIVTSGMTEGGEFVPDNPDTGCSDWVACFPGSN